MIDSLESINGQWDLPNLSSSNMMSGIQQQMQQRQALQPFQGIFQTLSQTSQNFRVKLDKLSRQVDLMLQTTIYIPENPVCEDCGTTKVKPHDIWQKPIKDVSGEFTLNVLRLYCPYCEDTFTPTSDLTTPNSPISLELSKFMVILYIGGCSLRYTAEVVLATCGVDISHNTVRNHVLYWGEEIKRGMKKSLSKRDIEQVAADEKYVTMKISQDGSDTAQLNVLMDAKSHQVIRMDVQGTSQLADIDVRRMIKSLPEEPERIVTDKAAAYVSVIPELLPGTDHYHCLQHRTRNTRKTPFVKNQIKGLATRILTKEIDSELDKWGQYINNIEEQIETALSKGMYQSFAKKERYHMDQMFDEALSSIEERRDFRQKILQSYYHRHFYVAKKTAEFAKAEDNKVDGPVSTAMVEGFNRFVEQRNKEALGYGSLDMIEAVSLLISDYFNTKREGGLVDSPFSRWNLFNWTSQDKEKWANWRVNHSQKTSTPLKIHDEYYGQARSYQLSTIENKAIT